MTLITLMTDFGVRDGYSSVMEGVIYKIAPDVKITNITHLVPPQNIREGSLIWSRSFLYFPPGTIHVGVVDPGVGTQRRPIAARLADQYFVCPDNGLITLPWEIVERSNAPVQFVHLNRPQFWLSQISNVFHGRDIFSPAAAYLAAGVPLEELGDPIEDPKRLAFAEPQRIPGGWRGEVTTIDHFGNIGTNLTPQHTQDLRRPVVRVGSHAIIGIVNTFGDRTPGTPVALFDSDGTLAVAIVLGNAAQGLNIHIGDLVEVAEEE